MGVAAQKPKAKIPVWARVVEGLGWLVRAAGIVPLLRILVPLRRGEYPGDLLLVIPGVIACASLGLFLGGIPIAIARSAWLGGTPPRWRLWAKTLLLIGAVLCISIPVAVYFLAVVAVPVAPMMTDQDLSDGLSALDPRLVTGTLLFGGPFFILGLCLVVPALIWGRRKPMPSIPDVLN